MVCSTALFSKQSRNFNCPTFQMFIAIVQGGGGQNLSNLYLKPISLSHGEGSVKDRTFHEKENLSLDSQPL